MDNYGIWIVLLVILFAVGQVLWVLPSPRQRGLAKLRQAAYEIGLRPEQRPFPDALGRFGYAGQAMQYRLSRPVANWPRRGELWLAVSGEQDGDGPPEWVSGGGDPALLELLSAARALGVQAVELDRTGAGFYWDESSEPDRLKGLADMLQQFVDAYLAAS